MILYRPASAIASFAPLAFDMHHHAHIFLKMMATGTTIIVSSFMKRRY
ncbi:MAG: hypothetical protein NTX44_05385 [Ignavibacteriales bacterium]|nr:hypothetical protein [Ignavibacteriales bacterium]